MAAAARSNPPQLPALIGVIHLPALAGAPGAPDASSALARAGLLAVTEAKLLAAAGFDGVILENFGDIPFYKQQVPPETIASLAIIAAAVREAVRIPVGINILRNDARAALAVAAVAGCDFIRVNVLAGVAATDQGLIESDAAFLLRERERLGARHVAILGDVDVKHARTLSSDDIGLGVEEVALRAGADGVIVTGSTTGRPVQLAQLEAAHQIAHACGIPLYVGSGATLQNITELQRFATGVIVGSALRRGGQAGAPLEPKAVRAFVGAFHRKNRKAGANENAVTHLKSPGTRSSTPPKGAMRTTGKSKGSPRPSITARAKTRAKPRKGAARSSGKKRGKK